MKEEKQNPYNLALLEEPFCILKLNEYCTPFLATVKRLAGTSSPLGQVKVLRFVTDG
uniref:hypothetical protein n=1 Tax=Dialister hominis TaxID=2582419 RepID=UPI003FF01673